jgi:hypothetical protein
MATYYHHFFARGCELAGCDAPDGRCDLSLIEGERRAVRACSGAHAKAAAMRAELEAEIERAAEQHARLLECEPALDGDDAWARCEACGELTEPRQLALWEGRCARCVKGG